MAKAIPIIPKLSAKHYQIGIPGELAQRLAQPVKGEGGWQTLLKDLQGCLELPATVEGEGAVPTLDIPEALIHRMIPYAVKFGSGGYQGVIRWVLCLVLAEYETQMVGTVAAGAKGVSLKPTHAVDAEVGVS